jgi:hypothetical protein
MPIQDDNIAWNRRRLFIPAIQMAGFLESGGTLTGLGAGSAVFQEALAAAELAGIQVGADGDEIYHFLPIPWDINLTEPIRFRVWFVHGSTDADTPVFSVAYKGIGKQGAISDAKSSPDETCTFGAHTCSTTNNSLEITAWKESTSYSYLTATDFAILLALTVDTMSASANEITILGLELDYTVGAASNSQRQFTRGQPTTGTSPND